MWYNATTIHGERNVLQIDRSHGLAALLEKLPEGIWQVRDTWATVCPDGGMMLITLLVVLVVALLIFWAITKLSPMLPPPANTIVYVIAVILLVLWVLSVFGLLPGGLLR